MIFPSSHRKKEAEFAQELSSDACSSVVLLQACFTQLFARGGLDHFQEMERTNCPERGADGLSFPFIA